MPSELQSWLLGVITSAGVVGFAVYILRSTISRYFTKGIEYHFEKKFEKFKSEIREQEKEVEQLRAFIVSARRERDSTFQSKKFEAAEVMMQARQLLGEFTIIVEYLKVLKTDEILKSKDPKIFEFIDSIVKPLNIEEKMTRYNSLDKTLPNLYLSEKTLKIFHIYESILFYAIMKIKLLSFPGAKSTSYLKTGAIGDSIVEVVPQSKESFDKYGDDNSFYWLNYFYTEILNNLRNELLGSDTMSKDTEAATRLALDSRRAQQTLLSKLQEQGIPEELLTKPKEDAEQHS